MNALYLTYAILAATYYLLRKKWDTKWLQQGNYLFLAIAALIMLITNGFEYGVAYLAGYLNEMIGFFIEKLGNGFFLQWMALLFLPTIAIINFFRKVRMYAPAQLVLWCLITGILLVNSIQQESFDAFLPFYSMETAVEPGWHTYIPPSIGLLGVLLTVISSALFTYFLGWFLKRRHERRWSKS